MNLTIEDMAKGISSGMEQAQNEINKQVKKRKRLTKLDPNAILGFLQEEIAKIGMPVRQMYAYHYTDVMEVYGTIIGMSYEEMIEHDDATMSYNGNYLLLKLCASDNDLGINLIVSAEAKLPAEEKEILRACNKIEDVAEIQQVARC